MFISRNNAVNLCLQKKPHLIKKLYFKIGNVNKQAIQICRYHKIPIFYLSKEELSKKLQTKNHQNIGAEIHDLEFYKLREFLKTMDLAKPLCVVALDRIENVANLGAIIRTSYALGIDGIILCNRNQAPLNDVAINASAGAILLQKIIIVNNLNQALLELKTHNFFILGAAVTESSVDYKTTFYEKYHKCLVLGNEHDGLRYKIREKCDELIKIQLKHDFDSLNVSVAAAILINHFVSHHNH